MSELMIAAMNGKIATVRALIASGADVNAGCRASHWQWDEWNKTPLMYAAERGHVGVVRELLRAGADPNLLNRSVSKDSGRKLALHYAARHGHLPVVRDLIEAKSKLNIFDEARSTPLMLAAMNGHLEVMRFLLAGVADDKARRKLAGEALLPPIISLNGVTTSVRDGKVVRKRTTPIPHVMKIVRALLDCDADANVVSRTYGTALEAAASFGHLPLVRLLVESGADANLQSWYGNSALRGAAVSAHMNVVKYLLQQGADPHVRAKDGLTPLTAARRIGEVRDKKKIARICELMEKR